MNILLTVSIFLSLLYNLNGREYINAKGFRYGTALVEYKERGVIYSAVLNENQKVLFSEPKINIIRIEQSANYFCVFNKLGARLFSIYSKKSIMRIKATDIIIKKYIGEDYFWFLEEKGWFLYNKLKKKLTQLGYKKVKLSSYQKIAIGILNSSNYIINYDGAEIKLEEEYVSNFGDEFAFSLNQGEGYLINALGEKVYDYSNYIYYQHFSFIKGRGFIEDRDKEQFYLINLYENQYLSKGYDFIHFMYNSVDPRSRVKNDFDKIIINTKKNEKWGLINFNGIELLKNVYDEYIKPLGYNYIVAKEDLGSSVFYINNGKTTLAFKSKDEVVQCFGNLFLIKDAKGLFGLADFEGNIIIAPTFSTCYSRFDCNLLVVKFNGKYGILNLNGKVILDYRYDKIILPYSSKNFTKNILVSLNDKLSYVSL